MSTKRHKNACVRIRYSIASLISLGIAAVILWGLVQINDPEAKLYKLNLRNVDEYYSTVYLEIEVTNPNYFRGFNHTGDGWVELFYLSNNQSRSFAWHYSPAEYQGFRKTLRWTFAMNITANKLDWPEYSPLLKTQESHIYVSLYLTYWYKILLWTTKTNYYQWLDTNAYLNNNFNLKDDICYFNQTTNFTLAIGT